MNYNEIIKPYLIDFDKLEVGDTLWSVTDGEVTIIELDKDDEHLPICVNEQDWYGKKGFGYHEDKYPTLFTSNPFENLQRVEPLEMKCDEACEYHCTQGGQTPKECDVENAIKVLKEYNAWRKGADTEMQKPTVVSDAIEKLVIFTLKNNLKKN